MYFYNFSGPKADEEIEVDDSDMEYENNDDISNAEDNVEEQEDLDFTDSESSESDAEHYIDILESVNIPENVCNAKEDAIYKSESGLEWYSAPPQIPRSRPHNISTQNKPPGLQGESLNVTSVADMFYLFISKEMVEEICLQTNLYVQNLPKPEVAIPPITVDELYAFIGVLLSSGKVRGHKLHLSELWTNDPLFGQQYFTAAMSRNRFIHIFRNIHFDDKSTRQNRFEQSGNRLEAIKSIFGKFLTSCKTLYSPGSNLTVGERLAAHVGKCPFGVYMQSKPEKRGIKMWTVSDSLNAYVLGVQVYTGMGNGKIDENDGCRVVNALVRPYRGSYRGVTTDNVFTSVALAESLLVNGLTLTGTLPKNNKDIPPQFLADKSKAIYSSNFGFNNNLTLVSYVPKRNNAVILLSTQFNNANISTMEGKQPEIFLHYSKTKIADEVTRDYCCMRPTQRWPFRVFMEMLDIASLNAYVLWIEKNPEWQKNALRSRRKMFINTLSIELAQGNVQTRKSIVAGYHKQNLDAFDSFLSSTQLKVTTAPQRIFKTGCCRFCKTPRRTRMFCSVCRKPICQAHRFQKTTTVCVSCSCRDSEIKE